jgi:hypothetical protein
MVGSFPYAGITLIRSAKGRRESGISVPKDTPNERKLFVRRRSFLVKAFERNDAKYPLTSKNGPPILPPIDSNTSSNKGSSIVRDMVITPATKQIKRHAGPDPASSQINFGFRLSPE